MEEFHIQKFVLIDEQRMDECCGR